MKTRLVQNIAALGAVQLSSYLIPLITLPYVTRILGAENWGRVALAQIILTYFTMVTNWGFGFSGTRKIAANRGDAAYVSAVFMAAWAAQWALLFLSGVTLLTLVWLQPFFESYSSLLLIGFGITAGSVLFPIWLLNGLERMKQVATVQIATRFSTVPLIFLFVRNPDDGPALIAINAGTALVGGFATMWWITRHLGLRWGAPSLKEVAAEFREGAGVFASTVAISLYTSFIPALLGVINGPTAVGYYALADRIRLVAQSVLSPIANALFPRMSHLFMNDIHGARQLVKKASLVTLPIAACSSAGLWILSDSLVVLLGGEQFRPAGTLLRIMAPMPLIIALSNLLGIQIMLPSGHTRAFNRILHSAALISLGVVVPSVYWLGAQGAASSALLIEFYVTAAMLVYAWKSGLVRFSDKGGRQ